MASEGGSGSETCTFAVGFDQPRDFDLEQKPRLYDAVYKCCGACEETDGESRAVLSRTEKVIVVSTKVASLGCGKPPLTSAF